MSGQTDLDSGETIADEAILWAENAIMPRFSLDRDQIPGSSLRRYCLQLESNLGSPAAVRPADAEIRAQDGADEPHRRTKLVAAGQGLAGRNVRPDPCSARDRRALYLGTWRLLIGKPGVEMPSVIRLLALPILLA